MPVTSFAVLDIFQGYNPANTALQNDCVDLFRNNIGGSDLSYGAAYYPWLNTNVINSKDLSCGIFNNIATLKKLLSLELTQIYSRPSRQTLIKQKQLQSLIEQSIHKGLQALVFEPNDQNLWSKTKGMIENFLMQLWQQGALTGAKPEQAYFVNVGLNTSMSSIDILEGRLIVQLGIAMSRPAEFIVLRIELKMSSL